MVKAFDLAFDLDEKAEGASREVEGAKSKNKQLDERLVSRDEEVQVR